MTRAELRQLCEAATPGPWRHVETMHQGKFRDSGMAEQRVVFLCMRMTAGDEHPTVHDARFIVAARAAVPELLDENERLRAVLEEVEWSSGEPEDRACPTCSGYQVDGHSQSCALGKALGR